MTLAYRGVKYERDSLPLEMKTGDIGGKYRGQDWNHHYPRHMLQLEPKLHRQYRGVAYSTRPHLAGQVIPSTCPLPVVIVWNVVYKSLKRMVTKPSLIS